MTPDPEAQEKVAALKGEMGAEQQFAAISQRTAELIDRAFALPRFVSGAGAAVMSGENPLIYRQR